MTYRDRLGYRGAASKSFDVDALSTSVVLDKRHSLEYRLDGALWRGIDKEF
jgi:hypothetical protein